MQSSIREIVPALAVASAMVLAGVILGLLVASRKGGPVTAVAPTPPPVAAIPTPSRTPAPSRLPSLSPTPTSFPSRSPSLSPTATPSAPFPTAMPAGPNGLPGTLPFLDIDGADPTVVSAIRAAVDQIRDLESYRYTAGTGGRSILNLASVDGLYVGARGFVTQAKVRSADVLVAIQSVEFNGGAGISSTSHLVFIGDRAWELRTGEKPKAYPTDPSSGAILGLILPAGFAERVLLPFAGGYELVGPAAHGGRAAIHYRATEAGKTAYTLATGVEGTWSADVWVATTTTALVGVEIKGQGAGQDGFQVSIELTDVNDADIVVKVPK